MDHCGDCVCRGCITLQVRPIEVGGASQPGATGAGIDRIAGGTRGIEKEPRVTRGVGALAEERRGPRACAEFSPAVDRGEIATLSAEATSAVGSGSGADTDSGGTSSSAGSASAGCCGCSNESVGKYDPRATSGR